MSDEIARLLDDAVGDVPEIDVAPAVSAGARRRHRRRIGAGAAVVASVALVVTGVVVQRDDDADRIVTSPPDESGTRVFGDPTGVVLLFDDGYYGVTALDLDTGVATRRVVEGQLVGDRPTRLSRSGDALIVGSQPPFAAPIAGGPSIPLGGDGPTAFVPAFEDGQVWVIESVNSPTRQNEVYQLVDTAGEVLGTWGSAVADSVAVLGIPGGLVLQWSDALEIWTIDADDTTRIPAGRPLDASGMTLAWCPEPCRELTMHDLATHSESTIVAGEQTINAARFSPDGRSVAVNRAAPGGDELVVIDSATGQIVVGPTEPVGTYGGMTWSPDGTQLFYHSRSYDGLMTEIGRIDLVDDTIEVRTLPISGLLSDVVALDRTEAAAFVGDEIGAERDCPAPAIQPSGRADACSFLAIPPTPSDTDAHAVVYLGPDATREEIDAVASALDVHENVGAYEYLDKQAAYAEFASLFEDSPELLASVTPDILPTSFRIELETDDCGLLPDLEDIASLPGVRQLVPTGSCS